jgi:hypothetical protein
LALRVTQAGAAEPLSSPDFSAEIVGRDAAGLPTGPASKVFVASGKARIETPQTPAGFFLVGESAPALYVLPTQKLVLEAKGSTPLTQVFVRLDSSDACPRWRAAAYDAGVRTDVDWHCERLDSVILDGRRTVRYQVLEAGRESERWIDAVLAFPVKLKTADGITMALEHIQMESQRPSLFEVPPDYRRLDPQALIERVRHSDVWVAP